MTTCWNRTIRALLRAADKTLVSVKPTAHGGMFQDSILEGLISPDAVNGKGQYKTILSRDGEKANGAVD